MTMSHHLHVITGGPGSGKSSVTDALAAEGFRCMPETGRAIIQDQVAIGGTALPWADREAFAALMLGWEMRSHGEAVSLPEINNLSVARPHRKRGVATGIIRALEAVARASGKPAIGIGGGLYADYGDAQRLYARLGFRPDGAGVTYQGRRVEPGEHVRLDDDLILWLSKAL